MSAQTCPSGCHVIPADATRAIGRFDPTGPLGFQATTGGPIRVTREAAVADYVARLSCTPPPGCERVRYYQSGDVHEDPQTYRCERPAAFEMTVRLEPCPTGAEVRLCDGHAAELRVVMREAAPLGWVLEDETPVTREQASA